MQPIFDARLFRREPLLHAISNSYRCNIRHASSSAAAATAKLTPSKTVSASPKHPSHTTPIKPYTIPKPNPKLNPSHDTYAPELSVPARRSDQAWPSYLWNAGKAYVAFYKEGIKRVRTTATLAKRLRKKAANSKGGEGILTRAEWQIIRRSRQDMLKLPAIVVILIVFGEWTPLLVRWLTPIVPEACRIPGQVRRTQEKAERRREERERRLGMDAPRLIARDRKLGSYQSIDTPSPNALPLEKVGELDLLGLLSVSAKLDAHSGLWDRMILTPPKPLLRWGVRRRLEYVKRDDELIQRDGGWQGLERREMERACIERGIDTLGRNEGDLRRDLAGWFGEKRR